MGTLGIDISHYTSPLLSTQLECLKAQGCKFVIVGMQDDSKFVPQIKAAHAAGLRVEAYIYLYAQVPGAPHLTAVDQVEWTYNKLREAGLLDMIKRMWLDVEDGFESGEVFENRQRLGDCIARWWAKSAIIPVGIYTRRFYWREHMGNTDKFSTFPLWDAAYDDMPNMNYFVPYGGWPKAHTKQYMNTNDWCGVNNDRNYREVVENAPVPPPAPAPPVVTAQAAYDLAAFQIAFDGAVARLHIATVKAPGEAHDDEDREMGREALARLAGLYNLGPKPHIRVVTA